MVARVPTGTGAAWLLDRAMEKNSEEKTALTEPVRAAPAVAQMNLLSWASAAVCSFHRRQIGPNSSFRRLLRAPVPFSRLVQGLPSRQRLWDSD